MRLFEHELKARQILSKARVDSPGLCARLLAAHAAGLEKIQYIINKDTELDPAREQLLQKLVSRRAAGEPLAYILGYKEFFGLDFFVDSSTLTPRPETELLVELALELMPESQCVCFADLGCGSGCIGLSLLSQRPHWRGLLLDSSARALAVCRRNQLALTCANAALAQADIFHLPLAPAAFELVVSNPPYIAPEEKDLVMAETLAHEPHSALFSPCNGLAHLEAVIAQAAICLVAGGYALVEHGAAQREAVAALLGKYGFEDLRLENDLAGLPRCAAGRKGGKMAELKDFSLCNIDWDMTPEQAVTMYLEWGNNDWKAEYPPVRSKEDVTQYFVIDTWGPQPVIRLVRRNSENAEDLFSMPLPQELRADFTKQNGDLRGVSAPTAQIKAWLKKQLGQENMR